jgi:predicted ferric reductase
MLSSKTAKMWPGAAMAYEIHQHASVLGMLAAIFHALILLGDTYMDYTLATLLIPFSSTGYKPLWIGLGQLALYAFGIVIASSYVRKKLGRALWHAIHVLAYGVFLIGLVHSIGSGTDTGTWWAQTIYWVSGGSIAFLTFYRTLDIFLSPTPAKKRTPASQSPASQSR